MTIFKMGKPGPITGIYIAIRFDSEINDEELGKIVGVLDGVGVCEVIAEFLNRRNIKHSEIVVEVDYD